MERGTKCWRLMGSEMELECCFYKLFLCTQCTQTGANDLQTLADRLVQQSICASLSKSFPKITIIGEEVGI